MPTISVDVDDVESVVSLESEGPHLADRLPKFERHSILKVNGKVPEVVYSLHLLDSRQQIIDRKKDRRYKFGQPRRNVTDAA